MGSVAGAEAVVTPAGQLPTYTDTSAGGISVTEAGTGPIVLTNSGSVGNQAAIKLSDLSTEGDGILLVTQNGTLTLDAGFEIILNVTNSPSGAGGIQLLVPSGETGGILLSDAGGGGVKVGAASQKVGFYGVTPVARQSSTGVTTVSGLITLLQNVGLIN